MSGPDLCSRTAPSAGYAGPDPAGDALLADLLDAIDHHLPPELYLVLRARGAEHGPLLELFARGCHAGLIFIGLRSGATTAELLSLNGPWSRINPYAAIRTTGQPHEAALQALDLHISGTAYARAIDSGATHQEIVEYQSLQPAIADYALARSWAVSHDQLIQGVAQGISAHALTQAAQRQVSFADLVAAVRAGANPLLFVEHAPQRTFTPSEQAQAGF
jgi:hypothetical protein